MSAPKRKREVQLNFRVSPEELALIEQKMAQLGTKNREAYQDFELLRRTKGRREVTEADEKAVKELCQPYLDWRKEALK